ncbi:ANTAR domain-containing protein [Granulicoccus sp. GXG6511]|uniref:ANTAR domain-containing protein n=1 Tax=Granulicoccus sp. GXG6511 TaxID=3381351 RepID=UPI003D7E7732
MRDSSDGHILEPSITGLVQEIVTDDPSIEQVLERVVDLATTIVNGTDGASITLFKPDLQPYTMVASDEWVREVDRRQYETQQGPCIEVAATSAPTAGSADLADSDSWPVFGPAVADLGVRAVLAAGLAPHPDPTNPTAGPAGALNVYSRKPFAFGIPEREETLLLAAIAGLALQMVAARTDTKRMIEALSTRDVIGQAKGILMERHGIGEDEAFAILRRASNDLNVKLRDVAARVADRGVVAQPPTRAQASMDGFGKS